MSEAMFEGTPSVVDIVGPFEHHDVVIAGWRVPFLAATPMNGGKLAIELDGRMSVDMTVEDAERLLPFIADCIAVALGYTGHPGRDGVDEPIPSRPMVRMYPV